MSGVHANVELSLKRQNDGTALGDCSFPEVLVVFVEGASGSLSNVKTHVAKLFLAQCSVDLRQSPAAACEEDVSIDVLAGDLDGEVHWDLADVMGVLD